MSSHRSFDCYVIGGDTLLVECVDLILAAGHRVLGVITDAPRIVRAAEARALPVLDTASYREAIAQTPFDYLFAITHLGIVPEEVLALPKAAAINFHDGPLPRYSGLNAPVWALLAGESQYGVTWHLMTSRVDAGDVLAQTCFDISPDETALSLNTKCMAAAIESFPGLIENLAAGDLAGTPQIRDSATHYRRNDRPPAACLIDWRQEAGEIQRFVRALTFGPYPNPIGKPKTAGANGRTRPFVVTEAHVEESDATDADVGRILEVSGAGITVSTGSGRLVITGARELGGDSIEHPLGPALSLEVGSRLLLPTDDIGRLLDEHAERLAGSEPFWTARLRGREAPELPRAEASGREPEWDSLDIRIPADLGREDDDVVHATLVAALSIHLARTGRKEAFQLGLRLPVPAGLEAWCSDVGAIPVDLSTRRSFADVSGSIESELATIRAKGTFLKDLEPRVLEPDTEGRVASLPIGLDLAGSGAGALTGSIGILDVAPNGESAFRFDGTRLAEDAARQVVEGVERVLAAGLAAPDTPWTTIPLLSDDERRRQIEEWNDTGLDYPRDACVHHLIQVQVDRTPDAVAVSDGRERITYAELDRRANRLAHHLRRLGVGVESVVGVYVGRSVDLLTSTIAIWKAGGAYVPLDPEFPDDRLAFMLRDSGIELIIADAVHAARAETLASDEVELVRLDHDASTISEAPPTRPDVDVGSGNLAYSIYTSGSTGTPKGVLVEHRSVVNFFSGMDGVIRHENPGRWLAVTSLSFDISVLELFWTLARGFEVVLYRDPNREVTASAVGSARSSRGMDFGLFMWGNDDGPGPTKYRLMLEAARFFDQNGFGSVWTPERHFHAFGGPFPNPSVTGAALAAVTENLSIRSGSCVSPLHHPIRIAEEWAVVDNLSNGRVGVSFASGWQPNDFVIRPEGYEDNKRVMLEQIDVVRKLWRGESIEFQNPLGDMVSVSTLPRPVQPELPFWVTTAGNPETYRLAGSMGANVLTHLLGQSVDEVGEKIAVYREARRAAGLDPDEGIVTLMLHTLVGPDEDAVREVVREPMKDYLRSAMRLTLGFAWTFPAFKRPGGPDASPQDVDLAALSDEEVDAILEFAFDRYYEASGLFGDTDRCLDMVDRCKAIGVDEIACLLDFGVDTDVVLKSLPHLASLRERANPGASATSASDAIPTPDEPSAAERPAGIPEPESFTEQARRHQITHFQCTPSMARLLMEDPADLAAVGAIPNLFLGGEALPPSVARTLFENGAESITNMYGPTETTIWSTTHRLEATEASIPIGRPIANTSVYILDRYLNPVPLGIPGDLYIGGDGVTRGYHARPELTAERFVPDPFEGNGRRMYWTGDLARYEPDGTIGFLGRVDHQVKVRGYRIELGEIDDRLSSHPGVASAATIVDRSDSGGTTLTAYLVPAGPPPDDGQLRAHLRSDLPEYMVPGRFVAIAAMPLTPNGKIDRSALGATEALIPDVPTRRIVEPEGELEQKIAARWKKTLGTDRVGVEDNFFDIGGHSLLVVQLHRSLAKDLDRPLSLVDLYRFPTIRTLTNHLSADDGGKDLSESADRAARRREVIAARRRR